MTIYTKLFTPSKRWPLVALASLLLFSAVRDASMLFRYPVAVGADGYYYVLQVNELLNHGRLYFPSNTPLIFCALANAFLHDSGIHKELRGVALLIWAGWSAIRASETHDRRWIIFSVALLIGALLSHVSTWGIAFAIVVLVFLLRSVANLPLPK